MQNFAATWANLSPGRQLVVVVATFAVFLAVFLMTRGVSERNMSLLFGGVDGSAAAEILTSLEQQGVPHEVRGNAIYVATEQRDALRLSLAGQGLPASGGQGYELLDNLSGFSTTSQMFDAAYWRAKEGELARTIVANPKFSSARVHISTTGSQPFQRDLRPTAAVTVHSNLGSVSPSQVKALQFLVASAVSGLDPLDVAVIDHNGGLLSTLEGETVQPGNDDRADVLRARAERVLAARVGPGNAVVEVTMETVLETETISERLFDPESRVAISTDVQESAGKSEDSRGGDVTVASNVPDGDAGAGSGAAANENSETRALTNYEVSQTEREVQRGPGAIKRLTVAVLINEDDASGGAGSPRTPEELADLQELVSAAVGFDASRGDQITLRSMPFEPVPELGTEVSDDAGFSQPLDMMQLIQIGALAAVAIVLGLFVVRPILAGSESVAALPPPAMGDDGALGDDLGAIDDGPQIMSGFPDVMSIDGPDMGGLGMGMGDMGASEGDESVNRLRDMIASRETETLQILENWMEDAPETEKA